MGESETPFTHVLIMNSRRQSCALEACHIIRDRLRLVQIFEFYIFFFFQFFFSLSCHHSKEHLEHSLLLIFCVVSHLQSKISELDIPEEELHSSVLGVVSATCFIGKFGMRCRGKFVILGQRYNFYLDGIS